MIRAILLAAIGLFLFSAALYAAPKNRPQITTQKRYDCLMKYRSSLRAIGGKGTFFDLSKCPGKPAAVKRAFVVAPSERYVQLSQKDLECLGDPMKTTAVRNADDKIEIYVDPCGY